MTPANEIPELIGQRRGSKLAICNLQSTPIDHLSDIRLYAGADELMSRVMEKLDMPIPPFRLHRRLLVKLERTAAERHQLTLIGVDVDGTPVTFLKSARLENNRRLARSEPFIINFRGTVEPGTRLKLELEFMGHYGEPNLEIVYVYTGKSDLESLYILEYSPHTGEWKTRKLDNTFGDGTQVDMEKADDSILQCTASNGVIDDTELASTLADIVA